MKKERIYFVNISFEEQTLFEWKPPQSFKPTALDLHVVRENDARDIFFK